MFPFYVAAQIAMWLLWFLTDLGLPTWLIWAPTMMCAVHLGFVLAIAMIAAWLMFGVKQGTAEMLARARFQL